MNAGDLFFVDSNVLLYYIDASAPSKRKQASEWLDYLWTAGVGRLSWQVLHEFYWNAVKKMGLKPAQGREIVEDLTRWRPVDTTFGLVQQAWYWMDTAQIAYWDALIIAAAHRSGAQYLLSEDLQADRLYDDIRVVNPFVLSVAEFLG
jgi:predicted nucleic acid-binding protein